MKAVKWTQQLYTDYEYKVNQINDYNEYRAENIKFSDVAINQIENEQGIFLTNAIKFMANLNRFPELTQKDHFAPLISILEGIC